SLGLSPDGRTLAYLSQKRVRFLDLQTGRMSETVAPGIDFLAVTSSRWLPDSSGIEISAESNPQVAPAIDLARGARIARDDGKMVSVPDVSLGDYSYDGRELATTRLAWKRVEILRGAELVRTLPVAGAYDWLQVYEWSRDGRWLLIGTTLGL